ncbi:MAG: hypothetical protein BGO13_10665 [Burkholderiales bacterium 66-5]|nr:MAG: hypothetical protein BGO13_10665 [Burkholderiales bacterium 66-5]
MRFGFSLVGLLVALAIVAILVKKQLHAPSIALPPAAEQGAPAAADAASVKAQSRQVQQQVKQQVESLMQQPRAIPEDGQ